MARCTTLSALAVVVVCSLGAPRAALAASVADKAAAQALFDEGLKLMAAGKYESACPKLDESLRLDPAMGTRFRLSECYEAIGKPASAWAGYVEVADLARASGQASREKVARERAARLEPGLPHLEIVVATPNLLGLEIRRDDVVVGAAQWGSKIPVDPGTVKVSAAAPGKTGWKTTATIGKSGETAVVRVPALADAVVGSAPPAPAVASAPPKIEPATTAPRDAPPEPATGSSRRAVGGVLFGVGVTGVAASGVLGLMALFKYNGAGSHCHGDVCDPDGKQQTDSARSLANVATVVFGVSAAIAVTGGVVWLTAPSGSSSTKAALRVRIAPSALLLEGAF